MARPRKPSSLKVLQGTFRADRNPKKEPKAKKVSSTVFPAAPAGIGKYGRRWWTQIGQALSDMGVLGDVDMAILEEAANVWQRMKENQHAIYHDGNGKTRSLSDYYESRGYLRKAMPELIALEKCEATYASLCGKLGISPADRNKIDISDKHEDVDPMEQLLQGALG